MFVSALLRCAPALLSVLLFLQLGAVGSAETWREIRSPHFRVVTNGSEKDGRKVASEFEQMRSVFTAIFKRDDIETGAPLTVFAVRDNESLRQLLPASSKADSGRIAGEFFRGWEKQFATVELDTFGDNNQAVIFHEYTHGILHANMHWMPLWLDEGLAEFYGYTRFEDKRILIGVPSVRLGALQGRVPLSIETMLGVNSRSPELRDLYQSQVVYAEAWAMVHCMYFGPGMGNGEKLGVFLHKIEDSEPQEKAFTEVFGDPRKFRATLADYVARFAFVAGTMVPDSKVLPSSFTARELSPAEQRYELGCFHIGEGDRTVGRSMIAEALHLDPKLAGAHEEAAYAAFEEGKDEEANAEWKAAVALDPTLTRSNYALAMSTKPLPAQTPSELRATAAALRRVVGLNPKFAPSFVQLALIDWRLGHLQLALEESHRAEVLEPSRAGYHTLTGDILLQGHQPAIAASFARFVAGHWFGADHDEAVDLWTQVPPANQGDGPALTMDVPAGSTVLRGKLTSTECSSAPKEKVSVTLQPLGQGSPNPLTFVTDHRFSDGWADTLWWGLDHFNTCHHLAGLPAVIAYKPGANGEKVLVQLEVRNDLPTSSQAAASAPAAASVPAGKEASSAGAPQH